MILYIGDPTTNDLVAIGEVNNVRITTDVYYLILAMAVAYAWEYQS